MMKKRGPKKNLLNAYRMGWKLFDPVQKERVYDLMKELDMAKAQVLMEDQPVEATAEEIDAV